MSEHRRYQVVWWSEIFDDTKWRSDPMSYDEALAEKARRQAHHPERTYWIESERGRL